MSDWLLDAHSPALLANRKNGGTDIMGVIRTESWHVFLCYLVTTFLVLPVSDNRRAIWTLCTLLPFLIDCRENFISSPLFRPSKDFINSQCMVVESVAHTQSNHKEITRNELSQADCIASVEDHFLNQDHVCFSKECFHIHNVILLSCHTCLQNNPLCLCIYK